VGAVIWRADMGCNDEASMIAIEVMKEEKESLSCES
jgi:hypothetical protein